MPFTRSFEGYRPPRRYDGQPFTQVAILEAATEDGSYVVLETISLVPPDSDPANPASRNFTTALATLTDGWYIIRWIDASGASFDSDPLHYLTSEAVTAFATDEDVAQRLGRDLTEAEGASVALLLEMASATIAAAADKQAADVDPVPAIIKALTIELVCRSLANPSGLSSVQEQIGSYQYAQSFARDTPSSLGLTDAERRVVRRALSGINYEVRTPSTAEDYLEGLVAEAE